MNSATVQSVNESAMPNPTAGVRRFATPLQQAWVRSSQQATFLERVVTVLLSAFVFALPTDFHPVSGLSLTLPIGSLCIALALLSIAKRNTTVRLGPGIWLLAGFVIWSTISLAWCEYPGNAMPKLIKYWEFLPMTWVITQYAWDRRTRVRLFDAYLAGCCFGIVGIIHNFMAGTIFFIPGAEEAGVRYSFSTDPNYLALALVIGMPIALYRAASLRKRWAKIIIVSYLPAAILGVGLTGSRGAFLALLAAVLVFAAFLTFWKRVILLGVVAAFAVLAFALPSSITWRLSTTVSEISHGTLDGRTKLWDQAPRLIEEHPLGGMGAGAAEGVFDYAAHNTPLELQLEGGVIGLALFYGAFAYSLYFTLKIRSRERNLLVIISVIWLVGTLSISWDTNLVTWFILAILFSVSSIRHPAQTYTLAAVPNR